MTAPSFQSTASVWPLGTSDAAPAPSGEPKKLKRHPRNRKKSANAGAAPPSSTSTSTSTPAVVPAKPSKTAQKEAREQQQAAAAAHRNRTDAPWRGGSNASRGGAAGGTGGRGRGNGGGRRAPAAPGSAQSSVRGYSTSAAASAPPVASTSGETSTSSVGEDVGKRVPFARPGQPGGAPLFVRRPVSAERGAGSLPLPVPGPIDGRRRPAPHGQRGFQTTAVREKGKGSEKTEVLLREVSLKEGEEGGLAEEMMRLYEAQKPSTEAIAARTHLIEELTRWLNAEHFRWGHQHNAHHMPLRIEPFGSVRFGLGTSSSDLDLCLLDPYRPNGFVEKFFSSQDQMIKSLPDIYDMRALGRSLSRANLMDVTSIPDAAVPIVKFKVELDGFLIEADLNTNERLGVFNSRLINSYCNLHPLVRPLSVFVKFWAKQRGLNDPSGSPTTFSSYTYILLVIAYLQRLTLLPNLQSPELIESTQTPQRRFYSTPRGRTKRYKRIMRSVGWDVTFVQYDDGPPDGYEPGEADLVELARGFFHYWGEEFDVHREVVSVWNGAPLTRAREFGEVAREEARVNRERVLEENRRRERERKGEMGEGEVGVEEERRQDEEDALLSEFAAEASSQRPHSPSPPSAAPADGAPDVLSPDDQADALPPPRSSSAAAERPRPDSRASDPMEYVDFEEPERWSDHLLVVQDPFILTRNCAGNVQPDWVEELRVQMLRARDLIDTRAPLSQICANVAFEAGYMSVAERKWVERRDEVKRQKQRRQEKLVVEQKEAAERRREERRAREEEQRREARRRREEKERVQREEEEGVSKGAEEVEEGEVEEPSKVALAAEEGKVDDGKDVSSLSVAVKELSVDPTEKKGPTQLAEDVPLFPSPRLEQEQNQDQAAPVNVEEIEQKENK
ncbi:hypothetical protein JCM8547_006605 [Rhodosporidiobolus lusitaniae]